MEFLGLEYFLESGKRVYWLYLLTALLLTILIFWKSKNVIKKQFSKEVLWHKSAQLDYGYFILVSVIKILIIIPLIIGVNEVTLWILLQMQEWFGYMERTRVNKSTLLASYTFSLFVVNDFTRYWLHRMMHSNSWLWKFHKVHHSAEVLNPLTFYRVHPLENILFGMRYALSTGFVTALFIYFFGAGIALVEFMGVNILIFIFLILGANLRHSHIPLSYPKSIEKWFISPYQHQLHHSTKYCHTNFGSYLAVWDRLFKTLVTGKKRNIVFGLPNSEKVNHSILGALVNPIYKGLKL
jgi:sterol desaturase/sphingolipid hydroxylase (fatty acid hydroxylase superfamily)